MQLIVAEERFELHPLSPGLMLFPSVPLLSCWLKTKIFVSINGTVGIQPKHALGLSYNSMITLPDRELAAPLGLLAVYQSVKYGCLLQNASSCKSRENPGVKPKTDD